MNDRSLRVMASVGLAVGGALGMAGTFASSASLRGLAWGIDGIALVTACALLMLRYFKLGQEVVAAGFLVFGIGESLLVSGAAMDLTRSSPSFGAGVGLWAAGLALISVAAVLRLSRPSCDVRGVDRPAVAGRRCSGSDAKVSKPRLAPAL
jgi:hypothetical protein